MRAHELEGGAAIRGQRGTVLGNDLDHSEGQHGLEDSHLALREARSAGPHLHGIILNEVDQDWVTRIFGRGGFTLLPKPERLLRALPDLYRILTQEG
jgi:nitric oxide reductase NorD protein